MSLASKFPSSFPTQGDSSLNEVQESLKSFKGQYLIDGKIHVWQGAEKEIITPIRRRNGAELESVVLGTMPVLSSEESLKALDAACRAYNNGSGEWPTMSVAQRIEHIEKFIPLMIKQREIVVRLIMWEIAKSRGDAEKEFDRTVTYIVQTVAELKRMDRENSRFTIDAGYFAQIRRSPLGVVLCMGPFNYPLNETFATLIPALIMGNTVVFKPPRFGVLLHQPLLAAFRDAFPKGVVNTVFGTGDTTASPMMQSGKIDVLALIGSDRVADLLKKLHPRPHRLRSILGLGAKNPAIVLEDAELKHAVNECVTGALSFNGQRCTALKIIFVHRKIADVFLEKMREQIEALEIGMPWDAGVKITPIPEIGKPEQLANLLKDATDRGAKILNKNGGEITESFVRPALLSGVDKTMQLWHVEQFGPLVPVHVYDDLEDVLDYVSSSSVGQQIALFGQSPQVLGSLIDRLVNQVSRININGQCQRGPDTFPFTGRKSSAEGTLSVHDALRSFSIRTMVAGAVNDPNKHLVSEIISTRSSKFLSTDFLF